MADTEGVIGALRSFGKACQAARLAHAAHFCHPPGQDFVRIRLMPDIPNDTIVRRVVDMVQRDSKLYDAQARTKMPAGLAHAIQHIAAQFIGELTQLVDIEGARRGALIEAIEQGRRGSGKRDLAVHLVILAYLGTKVGHQMPAGMISGIGE